MTTTEFTNGQIALACWRAAKSELHSVMLAVCQVFINRAAAGYYSNDLYENAYRWLIENPGDFPDVRDPQFAQLLSKLDRVITGEVGDKTGGALWFCHKADLDAEKLPEGYSITVTIGNLVFIR